MDAVSSLPADTFLKPTTSTDNLPADLGLGCLGAWALVCVCAAARLVALLAGWLDPLPGLAWAPLLLAICWHSLGTLLVLCENSVGILLIRYLGWVGGGRWPSFFFTSIAGRES